MTKQTKNGWIVKTLVGFILTGVLGGLTWVRSEVIGNDKDSRNRDTELREDYHKAVTTQESEDRKRWKVQTDCNSDTRVALAEILKEIKYLRNGNY